MWFRGRSHIQLLQGDSATILSSLVETLTVPALFWLDGHDSAGNTGPGEASTPPAYPTLGDLCDIIRAAR